MNDDHMHAFVSECRESITALNNALLTLEDDPNDEEAIESVFRTAHTLKGNFGAMGFERASELAHVLEDLLEEIRSGEIAVTPDIMDAAFDGVDHIEAIVGEIEASGESETDPSATIERLRDAIEGADSADETAEPDDSGTNDTGTDDSGMENTGADDTGADRGVENEEGRVAVDFAHAETVPLFEDVESVIHATVSVDPDGMLGVDGMLILEPLEDEFGTFETEPPRSAVEEGEYDGFFDVFVVGTDVEKVEELLSNVGAVEAYDVSDVTGTATAGSDGSVAEAVTAEPDTEESDTDVESSTSSAGRSSSQSAKDSDISSVRVDVDRLDELHGLVEQLVTGRITIRRAIEEDDLETAETNLNDFDKVTSRLQNTVMDMRLIPLRRVVSNLPRVVRDVARTQGKEVSFEMHGEDIELDRSILTEIEDPLIHILRNAVDHGVEPPSQREAAEKPREGEIELRASRQRDHVTIEVSDDGGGIDADAVRQKAVGEGIITAEEAESLSDDDTYDLVFHPGFSTANEVTDVSGRGVGMDVVHSTVDQLDGTVNVDSELGEGTTVTLRLPVSVAIVNVLFVRVGQQEYGIPIKNIDELTHATDIETVNGDEVVRHDDEVYPVVRLGEALALGEGVGESGTPVAADGGETATQPAPEGSASTETPGTGSESAPSSSGDADDGMLVRIRESIRPVALRCDSFTDQEEVVVKPLEGPLSGIPGLSGTAILGDGNIVPILDVVSLEA